MIIPPARWETERIELRRATRADTAVAYESYTTDPEISRYMTWRPHEDIAETDAYLRRCEYAWDRGLAYCWSLWLKADRSFAGMLEARIKPPTVDIGYLVVRRLWRQGIMREAVRAFAEWALSCPEIHRVWAVCDADNVASAGLLESVGMQREGTLRRWLVHPNQGDTPRDCLCYSLVKNDLTTGSAKSTD